MSINKKMKERDITIDIAKGICIYLVVLGHCFNEVLIKHYIYLFHMPFFFFVSGFFFGRKDGLASFLWSKFRRLLIPFSVYWLYSVVVKVFFGILQTRNFILPDFHVGALWFLIALWNIYIIHYFVTMLPKVMGGGIAIASLCLAYCLVNYNTSLPLYLTQTFIGYPFFVCGNLFYTSKIVWGNNVKCSLYEALFSHKSITCVSVVSALLFMGIYDFGEVEIWALVLPNVFSLLCGAFSGIIILMGTSKMLSTNSHVSKSIVGLLRKLGQYSMHILGFHFVILTFAYYVTIPLVMRVESFLSLPVQTGEDIKFNSPWLAIFMAFMITLISMFMGEYAERKWPYLWGLKKMK